jgi:hypothetical protein
MVINIEVITFVKFMMQGDWYEEGVRWEIAFVLVFKQGNMNTILYICPFAHRQQDVCGLNIFDNKGPKKKILMPNVSSNCSIKIWFSFCNSKM